jgi:hypothetical protein
MVESTLLDFSEIRSQHAGFVGRRDLLAEIDELFLRGTSWVLVVGGPGSGKTALSSHYIARLEYAGMGILRHVFAHPPEVAMEPGLQSLAKRLFSKSLSVGHPIVPYHFLRFMHASWAAPATVRRSLASQLSALFPKCRDPKLSDGDVRFLPALLKAASDQVLVPGNHRLIIVIDGLDQIESEAPSHPLQEMLPQLPAGVSVLCTTRPYWKGLDWIERSGSFARIDLDGTSASNDATCRSYVQSALPDPCPHFPEDEALRLASGNLQFMTDLVAFAKKESTAPLDPVPVGFAAYLELMWRDLNRRYPKDNQTINLGFWQLASSTEGLSVEMVNQRAAWSPATGERFMQIARPLLRATGSGGETLYAPFHSAFRDYLVEKLRYHVSDQPPPHIVASPFQPVHPVQAAVTRAPGPIKKRHAFLVGVDRYPESPELKYCVNDVVSLAATLQKNGFEVTSLHDQQTDPTLLPTVDNIRAKLSMLNGAYDPDDLFLGFFSCHGMLSDGQAYLLGSDSRPLSIENTGLAVHIVMEYMKGSGSLRNLLLLDACHSGVNLGAGRGPGGAPGSSDDAGASSQQLGIKPQYILEAPYYLGQGDALLAGCSSAEETLDWDAKHHSVFSYYIIEALNGAADTEGKGFVTFEDLNRYVFVRVREWWLKNFTGGLHQDVTARFEGSGTVKIIERGAASAPALSTTPPVSFGPASSGGASGS